MSEGAEVGSQPVVRVCLCLRGGGVSVCVCVRARAYVSETSHVTLNITSFLMASLAAHMTFCDRAAVKLVCPAL